MYDIPEKRPWLTIPKMIVIALLILLIAVGAYLTSVILAEPTISVDYGKKANELARQRQGMPADAPDNWGLISEIAKKLEAARVTVAARHPDLPLDTYDFTFLTWPDAEARGDLFKVEDARAVCREWIEEFRNAGGFDDLAKLPPIPYAARPYPEGGPLVLVLLPELGHSRQLARMNSARMKLAADAGDEAERLAAFEEMLASARLLGAQTTLIDNLVAVAIYSTACTELRREIIERPLGAPAARELLAAMDRQKLHSAARAFDGERFSALDMIQRTYSDDGRGNGRFLPAAAATLGADLGMPVGGQGGNFGPSRTFNVLGLLQPGRSETEAKVNAIYDYFVMLADMTRAERSAYSGLDPTVGLERFKILEMLVPAIGRVLEVNDQSASEVAATRIMLALEVYRAENGAYPASLDELSPAILSVEPVDVVNGKGFGYRLLAPGADPDGRGYLLYSFGADGVDNGGNMGPAGTKPPPTALLAIGQLDFVYNLPRPEPKPKDEDDRPSAAEEAEGQQVEIAPQPVPGKN